MRWSLRLVSVITIQSDVKLCIAYFLCLLSSDSKAIMIKQKLIKRDAQIFWLILLGWDWQTMEAQPASASILCLPQGNAENKNAANMRLFTFYAQEPCTNARACRITRRSYIYFWHKMLLIKAKCSRIKNKSLNDHFRWPCVCNSYRHVSGHI